MFFAETIKGWGYQDEKTKRLVERIPKKSIAIVVHQDIDMAAAEKLISCEVRAVLNFKASMSGLFLHCGVEALVDADIPVFDIETKLEENLEGKRLMVSGNQLFRHDGVAWKKLVTLLRYDCCLIEKLKERARKCFSEQFKEFVGNSFSHGEKELSDFVKEVEALPILRQFLGKEVLIVARGANYEKDLMHLKPILKKKNFVIIAVDGGADGLLKIGLKPDFIIGDMDSVSEKSLKCGAKLLVHSYQDGRTPGEGRVASLQLCYQRIAFMGTSEDVAMIFSYCSGAKRLYTVGTRLGMNEFLEKGRMGMGSSLLTRMKIGHALVDLKGIHCLAEQKQYFSGWVYVPAIVTIAIFSFSQRFELLASLFVHWWGGR